MRWILNDNMFANITTVYQDEIFVDMNINAGFRTIDPDTDMGLLKTHPHDFVAQTSSLRQQWELLPSLGEFPDYTTGFEPIALIHKIGRYEIRITNINNPNVSLSDIDNESVKFHTKSNKEEYFNFDIEVRRQGFIVSKTINNAKILPVTDSTEIYRANLVGNWKSEDRFTSTGGFAGTTYYTLQSDGVCIMTKVVSAMIDENGVTTEGAPFYPNVESRWLIYYRSDVNRYLLDANFVVSFYLSYPVESIIVNSQAYIRTVTRD
jgi:hypothetical protein